MKRVEKDISRMSLASQSGSKEAQKAEAIRRAFEEQEKNGVIPFKSRELSPDDKHEQYIKKDFPAFIKKLRNELLVLTMEALGKELGVTKNHVAKMEAGISPMGKSVQFLFFDLVEKKLIQKKEHWNSLGKDDVDQLVPDEVKINRGWPFDREVNWIYSENSSLIVKAATPPTHFYFSEKFNETIEKTITELALRGEVEPIEDSGKKMLKRMMDEKLELSPENEGKENSKNNDLTLDSKEQTNDRDHKTDLDNEKLIKLQSELVLLKQEIKSKEEMLSLKDELISELRDRIELMKKIG